MTEVTIAVTVRRRVTTTKVNTVTTGAPITVVVKLTTGKAFTTAAAIIPVPTEREQ